MKKQIVMTAEQLQRVLTDLHNVAAEHPSEEQLIDYAFDDLTAGEHQQLAEHLAVCDACREHVEQLRQAAQPWQGPAGEQRVMNLRERLLGLTLQGPVSPLAKLAEQLRKVRLFFHNLSTAADPQVAYARTPLPEPEGFQTEDGSLHGLMVYDEQGNLSITLSSRVLTEGVKLRLVCGDWRREVELTRKTADQVGAKVLISSAEIADHRLNQEVHLEVDED